MGYYRVTDTDLAKLILRLLNDYSNSFCNSWCLGYRCRLEFLWRRYVTILQRTVNCHLSLCRRIPTFIFSTETPPRSSRIASEISMLGDKGKSTPNVEPHHAVGNCCVRYLIMSFRKNISAFFCFGTCIGTSIHILIRNKNLSTIELN